MTMPFIYYPKRIGLRWQVWYRYADYRRDESSGAKEWRALWGVQFWRWLNAARTASDMQQAYNLGHSPNDDLPGNAA